MSNMDLARLLKSVGQRTFVNHYWDFADDRLTNGEVADILSREDFSPKACVSKTYHARDVFAQGLEVEALEKIAASTRGGNEKTAKAAQVLLSEIRGK